jgi:hypothetical protein
MPAGVSSGSNSTANLPSLAPIAGGKVVGGAGSAAPSMFASSPGSLRAINLLVRFVTTFFLLVLHLYLLSACSWQHLLISGVRKQSFPYTVILAGKHRRLGSYQWQQRHPFLAVLSRLHERLRLQFAHAASHRVLGGPAIVGQLPFQRAFERPFCAASSWRRRWHQQRLLLLPQYSRPEFCLVALHILAVWRRYASCHG